MPQPQQQETDAKIDHQQIEAPFQRLLRDTQGDARTSKQVSLYSQRGDALFFTGQYNKAVASYKKMVELRPSLDASHWRLGIALFFANRADDAVQQFEKYHAFDDVDRENGIWRYLSQYRATDAQTAKKELLRYEKDDREPFPAVYRLFDGSLTPEQALAKIPRDLPAAERDKRLFYTELYIGLHLVVQKQTKQAIPFLRRASLRKWPQTAGGGPRWMWHVGRVQLKDLLAKSGKQEDR
ncbi:MAG: tetratricopeptide repeat protein [Planctomycetaceae bacterium]|nr:tetratricopeptide repeat protein [Planctomycetaceae bacterium]